MLMTLDTFIFETDALPVAELASRLAWRHARSERFQALPSSQFVGVDPEELTITGAIYPGQLGRFASIDTLKAMADAGEAYQLMDGQGNVLGYFTIEALDLKKSMMLDDGTPRKADFTLTLKQAPDA